MKIKKLSISLAAVLCIMVFCMMGCTNSAQAPEAFAVSIYKVEKEQDEYGNVYVKNQSLWKSYTVMPTQAIDLPDYNPEQNNKESKILYIDGYSYNYSVGGGSSSSMNSSGYFFVCKNKVQFIPYANSTLFVRERTKKTINFFYEGKNIKEYLSETQIEEFNNTFVNTYEESFSVRFLGDWLQTFFTSSTQKVVAQLYTRENGDKAFERIEVQRYVSYNDEYRYSYNYRTFNLIKNTNVYVKIETIETQSLEGSRMSVIEGERLARESGYTSAG
ncbi:MAG: hypothetical protein IJQ07_07420 [Clostridia bacterium]|nr:hypothetical protein [Clostridia bacterium]